MQVLIESWYFTVLIHALSYHLICTCITYLYSHSYFNMGCIWFILFIRSLLLSNPFIELAYVLWVVSAPCIMVGTHAIFWCCCILVSYWLIHVVVELASHNTWSWLSLAWCWLMAAPNIHMTWPCFLSLDTAWAFWSLWLVWGLYMHWWTGWSVA